MHLDPTRTPAKLARDLLQVWERGARASGTSRALLLLSAVSHEPAEALLELGIGARDARLMDLYERWFGREVSALARCESCGDPIELRFDLRAIRLDYDAQGGPHTCTAAGYEIVFRSATTRDLLAVLHAEHAASAETMLLARCVLEARIDGDAVATSALPAPVVRELARRMSEVDAQAEVIFDLTCAACGHAQHVAFDIAQQLWFQLERWAAAALREVHTLAHAYGWSERAVLSLSPVRRRAYLTLLGAN